MLYQLNHISVLLKKDTDNFNFPLTLVIKRDIKLSKKDTQAHYLDANLLYTRFLIHIYWKFVFILCWILILNNNFLI